MADQKDVAVEWPGVEKQGVSSSIDKAAEYLAQSAGFDSLPPEEEKAMICLQKLSSDVLFVTQNISLRHFARAQDTLFQSAIEGHVLVKNDNALPLKPRKYLGVFGNDAKMLGSMSETSTIYMDTPAFVNFTMWCGGAREYHTQISRDFESQDLTADATVDACLVFLNAFTKQGADRNVLSGT
ncbi:hypothetical protein BGZ61DRAFT_586484 [Ilyonectria robusta]|uniref:uncharacterized protein n=1 Tax=Ilyonectria robusta TaxID=1079257 RepID=UPI001E8D3C42|nr:uncharacterized protein BGZ61DRAFT_586484 [Ilyonectria robusta]KAH8721725.1 hypothetical protein BGZ61DRAFT_586484 [Ilyonectria robusta]